MVNVHREEAIGNWGAKQIPALSTAGTADMALDVTASPEDQ